MKRSFPLVGIEKSRKKKLGSVYTKEGRGGKRVDGCYYTWPSFEFSSQITNEFWFIFCGEEFKTEIGESVMLPDVKIDTRVEYQLIKFSISIS